MAVPEQRFHGFVTVQGRGTLALPASLRKRFGLDRSGAQVEIVEREDGVLELRPHIAVPASQAWFWTEQWQQREREASADLDEGRYTDSDDAEAFIQHLDS